ncbi:MAG: Ferrochelatase, protoheme ferro-lyase [Labilithrix sp.]|nr:Ferrochelatase, protoheme ferro-lyase [Labilithrix sp.]
MSVTNPSPTGALDPRTDAVLLPSHGTVEELEELPEFLTNIRRGHAPPPELLAEVRRRYEAIGGRSPLNTINRRLAARLEQRLGVPVRAVSRLFRPYPTEVLAPLAAGGVKRVLVVPLAQHSAPIYGQAVEQAVREGGLDLEVAAAANWGQTRELTEAFAQSITARLAELTDQERASTTLLLTAHSLPVSIIEAGDPYERELRASAEAVAARVRELTSFAEHRVCFQSQGMSTGPGGRPMKWLGPDLQATLREIAAAGQKHVVIAPIGFLADHVEILYDLDIEAKQWARELGLDLRRSASLDDGDGIVDALVAVTRALVTERRA